ncbi:hypothetical protein [Roseisolibacter sp. H3M3-2]|uniref:hypothetical protein n=1 Tax=Roseisolibacter sp. H3M3-2 TaxID=3031323 RepID=UPI0023DAC8DE|nr:hypothetical protein [Roseisolibacter sp. H3M3-2]MDF1505971.1 hypothetical protein [Roseisolibacter sp. H3M3-2]
MRTPLGADRPGVYRRVPALGLLLALHLAAGCASARPDAAGDASFRRVRGTAGDVSQRMIQGAALSQDPSRSLLDVLASYWPTTMRGDPRAQQLGGDAGVGVYVNGNYMGGWDFLRTVRSGEVVRVQRITQSEEFMRFGRSSFSGGVVLTFRGTTR